MVKVRPFCWWGCIYCVVLLILCIYYFTSPPWPQQNCPLWNDYSFFFFFWNELNWIGSFVGAIGMLCVCGEMLLGQRTKQRQMFRNSAAMIISSQFWQNRWQTEVGSVLCVVLLCTVLELFQRQQGGNFTHGTCRVNGFSRVRTY